MDLSIPLVRPEVISPAQADAAELEKGKRTPELLIHLARGHFLTNSEEGCRRAHPLYLEALQTTEEGSMNQLRCLHDLAHLEWALAKVSRSDPPLFSLYFNLASHRLREAESRYSLDPDLEERVADLRAVLLLNATGWLMPSGLRSGWQSLMERGVPDPLEQVDLLVFAVSIGDGSFIDQHQGEIRNGIQTSSAAYTRLEELRSKIEDLCHQLDERIRLLAVNPWLAAVELVLHPHFERAGAEKEGNGNSHTRRRPQTVLPLESTEVDLMITALEAYEPDFDFLSRLRSLALGPYAQSNLFPPSFCQAPIAHEMDQILDALEQQGLIEIARTLQQLPDQWISPAERILNRLEELAPDSWTHPTQVLQRPWYLEEVLELCERRTDSVDPARCEHLTAISEKLRRAQETEKKAAGRRRRRHKQQTKKRKKTL